MFQVVYLEVNALGKFLQEEDSCVPVSYLCFKWIIVTACYRANNPFSCISYQRKAALMSSSAADAIERA